MYSFCKKRICQNFDSFVFVFGCRKWKRRSLGRNFPFAPLFVLGEFGADRKYKINFYIVSVISLLVFVRDYGVHPRHSPRTFPRFKYIVLTPACASMHTLCPPVRARKALPKLFYLPYHSWYQPCISFISFDCDAVIFFASCIISGRLVPVSSICTIIRAS